MNQPAPQVLAAEGSTQAGWLDLVRRHVGSLRYGLVQIVVHEGQVTQIEKTERVRLDNRPRSVALAHQAHPAAATINR